MKRWGLFRITVALVVAAVAVRLVPEVIALTSATVSFGGTYSVGGGGTRLIYCSLSSTSVPLTVPRGNNTVTGTSTLTCYNNSATGVTLNLSILNSTLSGSGVKPPLWSWGGTSMSIAGNGGSASQTVTFSVKKNDTTGVTYTFTFDVSGTATALNQNNQTVTVLDYAHNAYSISIPVN